MTLQYSEAIYSDPRYNFRSGKQWGTPRVTNGDTTRKPAYSIGSAYKRKRTVMLTSDRWFIIYQRSPSRGEDM